MSQFSQNVTEFFKNVMRNSGIKLVLDDGPHVINKEQVLIVREIEKQLQDENTIERFMSGFKILVRKEENFKKALLATEYQNIEREFQMEQESLYRIFLRVSQLQSDVTELLLDQLARIVDKDVPLLRLILSQLRYLPDIKNPENLTGKLLQVIEIARFPSQLEILEVIPDIFPDSECNETAKKLVEILDNNDELSGAIITCLNSLNIDLDIRDRIQDDLLFKLETGFSFKQLPVIFEFLLNDPTSKNLQNILQKLRNCLDRVLDESDDSLKLLIFGKLEQSLFLKPVSDTWINVIQVRTPNDQKPCDFLILFMIHTRYRLKKRNLEILTRKRVKAHLFKFGVLEELLLKLPEQLFRDYFTSILEVALSLLKTTTDGVCTEFASSTIKALYRNKTTIFKQGIAEKLLQIILQIDQKHRTRILLIFQDLIPEIQENLIILMRLLEMLDRFDLNDIRIIFEILCELTGNNEAYSGFKDEIHMIIRKFLASCNLSLKSKGIIGAVILSQKLGMTGDLDDSFGNHSTGVRQAIEILNLAKTASRTPELLGLYYDQLSMIIFKCENLAPNFQNWLFESVTEDFQNLYVTDTSPEEFGEDFEVKYNINQEEELENPLSINIGCLPPSKKSLIAILPSHFRLFRLLHYRENNGVLSSIDALLGCGVILPKSENSEYHLHTINWFRELINAFLLQKNRKLRSKVLHRLEDLIQLESTDKNRGKYREIDTDLVTLLRYNLGGDPPASDENFLTIHQLNFILKDFVLKLQVLTSGANLGLSQLTLIPPVSLIEDCVKILPFLNNHFVKISLVLGGNDVEEEEIYYNCFGLILESLKLIFEWPGFQDANRLMLLRDLLKSFREKNPELQDLESVRCLSMELTERLVKQIPICEQLDHAVYLVKIMEVLHQFTRNTTKKILGTSAEKFLEKTWKKASSVNLDYLIKIYLEEKSVKDLCNFLASLETEDLETLPQLQSINKSNFYVLYRNIWFSLHECVKHQIKDLPPDKSLLFWKTVALTMQGLMTIAKQQETKSNLICFLKKCIAILKIFISSGVEVLEIQLKLKPDEVVEIFKIIQGNTRFLHHLCCYCKVNKDAGLMAYVPQFRLTLETLVYRVKAALAANNCSDAFWMGNLKNRDLQGEDILSQSTVTTSQEGTQEESLESDEEMEEEGTKSDSDVYE